MSQDRPDEVFEHDGMLWKPKPDCTTTFEEFVQARTFMRDIHGQLSWNPWVEEDRADEYQQAIDVFEQWQRGEPGHRHKTREEIDEDCRRISEEAEDRSARQREAQLARAARFDEARAQARLSLLEQEAALYSEQEELAGLESGTLYPAMEAKRRSEKIAELKVAVGQRSAQVEHLRSRVGDSEDVVDRDGSLPRERREIALDIFSARRHVEVRELRSRVAELTDMLGATVGRADRAAVRADLDKVRHRLDVLAGVPQLEASDMCSECAASPASWHGFRWALGLPGAGPCPAWPDWAARIQRVREMLTAASKRREVAPPELEKPKPKPIAVIPSKLPIAEVMRRLAEIQLQYPDAVVKRGNANKWEVWQA